METHNYKMTIQRDDDKSTMFIRPWEELQLKSKWFGLGYENNGDNLFHIPEYGKPITIVSGEFLDDSNRNTCFEDNDQEKLEDDAVEDNKDGDEDTNDQDAHNDVDIDIDSLGIQEHW